MDTMDITKIGGAACGALLIYLLVNWVAEATFHVESGDAHGSHGEAHDDGHGEKVAMAPASIYELEAATETVIVGGGPTIEELLASADVAKGKKAFSKCKACHKLEDGKNGLGPHLFNVVDRAVGSVDGFAYSGSITGLGGNWDAAALNGFLTNPKKYAPGTKMSFAGFKKPTDRANIIAYLATIK